MGAITGPERDRLAVLGAEPDLPLQHVHELEVEVVTMPAGLCIELARDPDVLGAHQAVRRRAQPQVCLLYTSDAADERSSVDLGGRRIIKKKNHGEHRAAAERE